MFLARQTALAAAQAPVIGSWKRNCCYIQAWQPARSVLRPAQTSLFTRQRAVPNVATRHSRKLHCQAVSTNTTLSQAANKGVDWAQSLLVVSRNLLAPAICYVVAAEFVSKQGLALAAFFGLQLILPMWQLKKSFSLSTAEALLASLAIVYSIWDFATMYIIPPHQLTQTALMIKARCPIVLPTLVARWIFKVPVPNPLLVANAIMLLSLLAFGIGCVSQLSKSNSHSGPPTQDDADEDTKPSLKEVSNAQDCTNDLHANQRVVEADEHVKQQVKDLEAVLARANETNDRLRSRLLATQTQLADMTRKRLNQTNSQPMAARSPASNSAGYEADSDTSLTANEDSHSDTLTSDKDSEGEGTYHSYGCDAEDSDERSDVNNLSLIERRVSSLEDELIKADSRIEDVESKLDAQMGQAFSELDKVVNFKKRVEELEFDVKFRLPDPYDLDKRVEELEDKDVEVELTSMRQFMEQSVPEVLARLDALEKLANIPASAINEASPVPDVEQLAPEATVLSNYSLPGDVDDGTKENSLAVPPDEEDADGVSSGGIASDAEHRTRQVVRKLTEELPSEEVEEEEEDWEEEIENVDHEREEVESETVDHDKGGHIEDGCTAEDGTDAGSLSLLIGHNLLADIANEPEKEAITDEELHKKTVEEEASASASGDGVKISEDVVEASDPPTEQPPPATEAKSSDESSMPETQTADETMDHNAPESTEESDAFDVPVVIKDRPTWSPPTSMTPSDTDSLKSGEYRFANKKLGGRRITPPFPKEDYKDWNIF